MRRNRKTRSNARRTRLSVSLFPFLAVLICTLGVLIMMLVMAVKAADDQVRQVQNESDTQQQAKIEEMESVRDVRLAQIDGLGLVRPEALSRLSDSRANRSHMEEEIRKLKREFRSVGAELVELDRESKRIAQMVDPTAPVLPEVPLIVELDETEGRLQLRKIEDEIKLAQKQLEDKRDSVQQDGPSRFVIVPHKGGGGTFRRPIFMECTHDAITLQPSGIRLAKSEFVPPLQPGNMLDSALLTIREYWSRYDLAGQEGSPYPLIVIRPGGAETFVLARHAMKSWDDEFGYELVESETPLEFGDKDEQLETEVHEAIREARMRQQQQLARSRHQQSGRGQSSSNGSGTTGRIGGRRRGGSERDSRPGLTADGARGGFVSNASSFQDSEEWGSDEESLDGEYDSFVSTASGMSEGTSPAEVGPGTAGSGDSDQVDSPQQPHGSQHSETFEQTTDTANKASASSASASNRSANMPSGQSGDMQVQNPYADTALAKERGRDWALPTQTPGATGYVRPIRVVCSRDLLEVFSGQDSKRIPMTGITAEAIGPMVDEVWAQIDQWGIPGANAYWKPQLRFRILDGGGQRYLELKGLLYKSGLTLTSARPSEVQR